MTTFDTQQTLPSEGEDCSQRRLKIDQNTPNFVRFSASHFES